MPTTAPEPGTARLTLGATGAGAAPLTLAAVWARLVALVEGSGR